MVIFLKKYDELGKLINEKCNEIFSVITTVDVETIEVEPQYKAYFRKCHLSRPHFSLATSAKLLYDAIEFSGKKHTDISLIDYGAGIGSLYVLAKKIGCKKVYYNDLDPQFTKLAKKIDELFGIEMDDYIVGDSREAFDYMKKKGYDLDLVLSRNVIEHIYDLSEFYNNIYINYPNTKIVSSTTANWRSPLAHLQHVYLHLKHRKTIMLEKRRYIKETFQIEDTKFLDWVERNWLTAGGEKMNQAIEEYKKNGLKIEFPKNYTNVCNQYGVWCENLISYDEHRVKAHNYHVVFTPGIWDESYQNPLFSLISICLNRIISVFDTVGCMIGSYVILKLEPKN